ncbi:MAG: hypothetical protein GX251_04405 [Firmicutes bacterium]|nr:hypothetical protein [Bacillota bacterium]
MRRTTFLMLVAVGILALGLSFFASQKLTSEKPPELEIELFEYNTSNDLAISDSPLAELQTLVDRLSQAAMDEKWAIAYSTVQELGAAWRRLTPDVTLSLETDREVETALQNLQYQIWSQDQQALLETAQKLSILLNQLSS